MNIHTMAMFFRSMEIKRATINVPSISDEDEEYEYIQLNDNDFQFGRVGDVLTNYVYLLGVVENMEKESITKFQGSKNELIRKVDHAMWSIDEKEYDEAMVTLKDVLVKMMGV